MIHYAHFVAHRASQAPLAGAIACLAVIAVCLGDPQAGVGTTAAAGLVTNNQRVISAPAGRDDERLPRVRLTARRMNDDGGDERRTDTGVRPATAVSSSDSPLLETVSWAERTS